ncbi:winged helix DNA-binding domain-containing protein [Nocardia sp. NPDC059177]|uniref:winged helix DNA-binding domain-containing protein n=1 Tax=Nocardia sp. NPDC059177 TaxID=3346759 RepID=UPI0036B2D3E0
MTRSVPHSLRRARLQRRHGLTEKPFPSAADAVGSVVAFHATDPATVFLGLAARLAPVSAEELSAELYDSGSFVKMHAMRRTVFIARRADVARLRAAVTDDLAVRERRAILRLLSSADLGETWLRSVQDAICDVVADGILRSGAALVELEPRLTQQVRAPDRASAKWVSIGSRLLGLLAMEGWIERGGPVGSWQSNQVTWVRASGTPPVDPAAARAWLLSSYLDRFGPATMTDLTWWTGWGKGVINRTLGDIGSRTITFEDGQAAVTTDDDLLDDEPASTGRAVLLPSLDPTVMGWKERDWYLGPLPTAQLIDRSGNIGPTVWWDGAVVGGWGQDAGGTVRWEPLAPLTAQAREAIGSEADRVTGFLDGRTVAPRFRTPLELRLAAS